MRNFYPRKPKSKEMLSNPKRHLMNMREAATFLNVKISWMRSAVFKNLIPYIKIGHHVRFEKEDLLSWIEKNKRKSL